MKKPHIHAAIIKAWADGESIEYKGIGDKWLLLVEPRPYWSPETEYRIKPTDKRFFYHAANTHGRAYRMKEDDLMLVFDSETGELKEARVL